MMASRYGHLDAVRTLLENGADVNAKSKVRNQMMMIIIISLTILLMMMMMIVINYEDINDSR